MSCDLRTRSAAELPDLDPQRRAAPVEVARAVLQRIETQSRAFESLQPIQSLES